MDETTLRTLLRSALADEPPIGPVADNALRAGTRLRRRRVLGAAGGLAAAAAIAVAIPAVTGPVGAPPASRQHPAATSGLHIPANVPLPDPAVAHAAGVEQARPSVVKIVGWAPSCFRTIESSGFVFAPQHVVTAAHLVAGAGGMVTVTAGHHTFHGTVVLYDPERDVAVLYVLGLRARPLAFAPPAKSGDSAAVAGYPLNGFTAVPARIGSEQSVNIPDIYQTHTVTRGIYPVRAVVGPGDAGGPLLTPSGEVDGMMFAAAAGLKDTGYALTASEIRPDVRHGAHATAPVSTHGCA